MSAGDSVDKYEMTDLVCPRCGEAMLVVGRTIVEDKQEVEVHREEP